MLCAPSYSRKHEGITTDWNHSTFFFDQTFRSIRVCYVHDEREPPRNMPRSAPWSVSQPIQGVSALAMPPDRDGIVLSYADSSGEFELRWLSATLQERTTRRSRPIVCPLRLAASSTFEL